MVDGNVHCFVVCVLLGEKKDGMFFFFLLCFFNTSKAENGSRLLDIMISLRKAPKKEE